MDPPYNGDLVGLENVWVLQETPGMDASMRGPC